MYYPNDIEDICYEQSHIDKVVSEIKHNISGYFDKFVETEGGNSVSDAKIIETAKKIGVTVRPNKKPTDKKRILHRLIKEAEDDFDSDRNAY